MKTKTLHGVEFKIDRPKGYVKKWKSGRSYTYKTDYGYFTGRLKGEDGEGLDAFVGDDENGSLECFQKLIKNDKGQYVLDETKFLVGLTDAERSEVYRLYGAEVGKRTTFDTWEDLMDFAQKFKPARKLRYKEAYWAGVKEASRDNPWPSIRQEGPIVGEDKDYEHAQRHFKFAEIQPVVAPPKPKKIPDLKPLPVPDSSAPQVLHPKQAKVMIDDFFHEYVDNSKNVVPTETESTLKLSGLLFEKVRDSGQKSRISDIFNKFEEQVRDSGFASP